MRRTAFVIGIALIAAFSILFLDTTVKKLIIPVGGFLAIVPDVVPVLFMVARPSMDLATDIQIVRGVNVASVATLLFILMGSILLLQRKYLEAIKKSDLMVKTNMAFFFLLLISLLSLLGKKDFVESFSDWTRIASVCVVFNYAFADFYIRKRAGKLLAVVSLSAITPLSLGLYQYLFNKGNNQTPGFNRIYGTFVHPNVFAEYLLILLLLALYFLRAPKSTKMMRYTCLIGLAGITFEIIGTYSRGVWIASCILLLGFSVALKKNEKAVLYFSLVIIAFALYPKIQGRFMDITNPRMNQLNSWDWRVNTWSNTATRIKSNVILGHGLGSFEQDNLFMAHNDYIRLAYETGILGLVAYLGIFGLILMRSIKELRGRNRGDSRSNHVAVVSLVVAFLVVSLVDNLARSTIVLLFLFYVIGALLGIEYGGAEEPGT